MLKQIGRELNVRYVLEGSVQRGGNRMRVNVQLIDAETGNHLWAERFDKPVADLFDMQDEIVARLANALDAELVAAEARAGRTRAASRRHGPVFPGPGLLEQGNDAGISGAGAGFLRARARRSIPSNVEAMVCWAMVVATVAGSFVSDDRATPARGGGSRPDQGACRSRRGTPGPISRWAPF